MIYYLVVNLAREINILHIKRNKQNNTNMLVINFVKINIAMFTGK